MITPTPTSTVERLQPLGKELNEDVEEEDGEEEQEGGGGVHQPLTPPQYMNSAALSEIAGELLVTVRELREELLQVELRILFPDFGIIFKCFSIFSIFSFWTSTHIHFNTLFSQCTFSFLEK